MSALQTLARPPSRLNAWVSRRHHPAPNIEIRALLDTFFVCAIATILGIRLQLWATNYPKLGGGKLHIAHLLWGGLGMLVAIVVLLSFLGAARRHTGAILGGVGFGFFIDEIDERRRQLIRELLERSDQSDPLVQPLTEALNRRRQAAPLAARGLPLVRPRAAAPGVLHRGVRVPPEPVRCRLRVAGQPRPAAGPSHDDPRRIAAGAAF